MASDKVLVLTKDNFEEEVLKSDIPVLVDFWAQWCGPCRAVAPVIDELAEDFSGKIKVGKVDVDSEGELAAKFRIMSIPTVLIFKNGEMVDRIIGAKAKADYANLVEKHL